jgi:hypothetical protein
MIQCRCLVTAAFFMLVTPQQEQNNLQKQKSPAMRGLSLERLIN